MPRLRFCGRRAPRTTGACRRRWARRLRRSGGRTGGRGQLGGSPLNGSPIAARDGGGTRPQTRPGLHGAPQRPMAPGQHGGTRDRHLMLPRDRYSIVTIANTWYCPPQFARSQRSLRRAPGYLGAGSRGQDQIGPGTARHRSCSDDPARQPSTCARASHKRTFAKRSSTRKDSRRRSLHRLSLKSSRRQPLSRCLTSQLRGRPRPEGTTSPPAELCAGL